MVTLEASNPFRNLNRTELAALQTIAREQEFPAGRDIFKEGDNGDGIYVVKEGLVEISAQIRQGLRRVFAQLGPGEMFGEMAVIELKPRSASATAAHDSRIYFIPRDELLAMIERSPVLSLEMLRAISHRLREFNQRFVQEILQAERLAIIGRFARSIVHDLKNPLNIIGITAEMAAMSQAPPEMRQKAGATIRKQVERISDMVTDILDFTQGAQPEQVLGFTDYGAFVEQLLPELCAEAGLRRTTIEVIGSLPAVQLRLDSKRLGRVFHNLVQNATDAMPEGGRIFLRFQKDGADLVTEVEDTGPGVAPEIAGKLFEAFATYGKEHGTGLGLSICKKIVEDHRGRIWTRNEPGKGAIFYFTLPLPKH